MKSKFGKRYMIMGSDAEVCDLEPIESPTRHALEGMRKAGITFAVWLMTGLWSALRHVILLPMKFVQALHDAQKEPGSGIEEPRLPIIPFPDWPPALRRARMGLEKRYRAFLAVNEREEREHMKGTQASTRLPPDDERERNMQFWDLWTPEEKEAKRRGNASVTAGVPREWLSSPRRDGESSGGGALTPTRRRRTLQLRADRGSVSPRADLIVINS
jgi:hypothetical protein